MAALEPESIDSIVTDPPYELGFMGRGWDSSGIAYQVDVWRAALRALKPGGHLLAFGGSRTYHRVAVAIEDAGFHVRDSIHWTYGCGFPKSMNVSNAMDKQRHDRDQVYKVTAWIASARDDAGLKNSDIDAHFGFRGMAGHWCSQKSQPIVPTLEQVPELLKVLGDPKVPEEISHLLVHLNGRKGQPGEAWLDREVTGHYDKSIHGQWAQSKGLYRQSAEGNEAREVPKTPEAIKWSGWGTALKASHEPIIVARKPFKGTVADTVRRYGTGAINIDACRAGSLERWPANSVFSHLPTCKLHVCDEGCAVKQLRQQTKALGDGQVDQYFPSFYYYPKPTRDEKEAGLAHMAPQKRTDVTGRKEGSAGQKHARAGVTASGNIRNVHPTVKPIGLMGWLCRLVTQPGGTVLDPFNGSGTTGCGAVVEGFNYIGFDLSEQYAEISRSRIKYWAARPKGGLSPERANKLQPGEGTGAQLGLFNKE